MNDVTYHPDPAINAEVATEALEAERADLAAGYPPRRLGLSRLRSFTFTRPLSDDRHPPLPEVRLRGHGWRDDASRSGFWRGELMGETRHSTYLTDQPWVCLHYGLFHDGWWPLWSSSRIRGRGGVTAECAVCGVRRKIVVKMPRFGEVNPSGEQPAALMTFRLEHLHRDKPHPMAWARPLLNPAAHPGGIDLDLLAMRLEAVSRGE